MSIRDALKEELKEALLSCLVVLGKSKTYEQTQKRCKSLKERINSRLEEVDALCLDSERYIDRTTWKIKESARPMLDDELCLMLDELGGLLATLDLFDKDENWSDDMMNHISAVLSFADYEGIENKITKELGLFEGRRLILEAKREMLSIDEELGLYFIHDQVKSLDGLIRTMTLFSGESLDLDIPDMLLEEEVNLVNLLGEYLRFRTASKLTLGIKCYLELELLEDITAKSFAYYLAESHGQGYRLTLVEDRELEKALDNLRDRLDALAGI